MVLTGFNTDIEHGGTTYHVQTEDKGRSNPFVESLVYARGEILYSRRTPYHDLVEQDLNPKAVASLMERQHRTIVEAIRRGRLTQLTGTAAGTAGGVSAEEDTNISPPEEAGNETVAKGAPEPSLDQVILDYLAAQRGRAHLVLKATAGQDFVYGVSAQVEVVAVDSHSNEPQSDVRVSVLFKSTAEPRRVLMVEGETNETGEFAAEVKIPSYNGGTSAVVITGESSLGQSEIKHLVHR